MVVSAFSHAFHHFPLLWVVEVGFISFTLVKLWLFPSLALICWADSKAAVLICLDDSGGYTLARTAAELQSSTEADVTLSQIAATLRLTWQA